MTNHEDEEMIEVVVGKGKSVAAENSITKEEFKQFDIIPPIQNSISDHHYYGGSSKQVNYSKETYKKIMKEWEILEECLPADSIFVRVYEERMDLLRAVIIGPSGTPYHDCLFFFDIQFPSDYPNSPPKVYYHSFGFGLNPNLYDNGKVCLSIINTWNGKKSEKWVPNNSTILQVLLSIQALVLNENPYYNEPTAVIYSRKELLAYNEYAYILSCKSILAILNNPPMNFEVFVSEYFGERAEAILTSCKTYMDGLVLVGHTTTTEVNGEITSKKFQDLARNAYSNLMNAFMKNGSSFENYYVIEEETGNDEFSVNQVNQLLGGSIIGPSLVFLLTLVLMGVLYIGLAGGKVGH